MFWLLLTIKLKVSELELLNVVWIQYKQVSWIG